MTVVSNLYGTDVWHSTGVDGSVSNTLVAQNADYALVAGRERVRQRLMRRYLGSPGEWKADPKWGAGLRRAVRSKATGSNLDQLKNNLRQQSMLDDGVESVLKVDVQRIGPNAFKYSVVVKLKGDDEPLFVGGNVT